MDAVLSLASLSFPISVIRFLAMLSVLVFVHELGHFLMAKLFGMFVPTFSIGFGRRLAGFKIKETDYRLSVIPFGGYVKMVGQSDMPEDPDAEQDPDEIACPDHMRFDAKPIWQRIAVNAAGPLVSMGFGIVVYWAMYVTGVPMPRGLMETKVGYVEPASPAMTAGIHAGDRVLTIDGYTPVDWEDLRLAIIGAGQNTIPVELEDEQGQRRTVEVTPHMREGESLASIGINFHEEFRIEEVMAGQPAAHGGLEAGDVVIGLRDPAGAAHPTSALQQLVRDHVAEPITFEVVRNDEHLLLRITPDRLITIAGLETDGAEVLGVDPAQWTTVARDQVPQAGDRVTAINGRAISAEDPMVMLAALGEEAGTRVPIELDREGRTWTVMQITEERGIVGIRYGTDVELYQYGVVDALPKAVARFRTTVRQTFQTIGYLISGSVSTRELAGPIGIAVVSEQAAKVGWPFYLHLVGIITINLGVLNILPIPVLDGGNIMILLIESVRRRPLSERAMYYVQHVGLVFIVFLMVFATYNDIRRGIEAIFG